MRKARRLEVNDLVRLDATNIAVNTPTGRVVVFEGLEEGSIVQIPVGSTGTVTACHGSVYTVKFPVGSVRASSLCLLLLKRRGKKRVIKE